jgi:homoserine kinase
MGGLVAGNALAGGALSPDTLLELATRAEGHPDNVAAALLGGLTVSCGTGDRVVALSLPVPPAIQWVVLIPEIEGSTREARAVLPDSVSRADAVLQPPARGPAARRARRGAARSPSRRAR